MVTVEGEVDPAWAGPREAVRQDGGHGRPSQVVDGGAGCDEVLGDDGVMRAWITQTR